MDIVSHGLWGSVAFGRKNRRLFWLAFFFGIMPDLFSFGIFFIERILTGNISFEHSGPPDPALIPAYVDTLYNFTHSLVIFALVFGIVWFFCKQPFIPLLAWCFHIVLDIFTHSSAFFPTPFLWPISEYRFDGVSWGHPSIFIPNLILLALAYIWFFIRKRKVHD